MLAIYHSRLRTRSVPVAASRRPCNLSLACLAPPGIARRRAERRGASVHEMELSVGAGGEVTTFRSLETYYVQHATTVKRSTSEFVFIQEI